MAKIDLSSVHRVVSKGRVYYYAWRGKDAPRILARPGSPAFVQELAAALVSRKTGADGHVDGLVVAFKASDDWSALAPKTRQEWGRWLDIIRGYFGKLPIAAFGRPAIKPHIRRWRDRYRETPRSADMALQALSRLMSFAVYRGEIDTNPCVGIEHLYSNDRSSLIWTDGDFAALKPHASREVFMAAKLASLTGLRRGDLLRLSWSHVGDLAIEIRTGKSGGRKTTLIPLYGELGALLSAIPKRATTVLTNTAGAPWGSGFGASWGRAVKAAGLDLHFHDLRGTAATRMYLADLTIREIAEIMTWGEDHVEALINRYVKRDELLRDRIRRMGANTNGTGAVKPSVKPSR